MGCVEHEIATFARNLQYDYIPVNVRKCAAVCFADAVGAIISGGTSPQQRVTARVVEHGSEKFRYVAGMGLTDVSLFDSIWINASCAHSQEYNDLFYCQPGHPSAILAPTAIGLGMELSASGKELLTAYVAGFEVMACVNQALLPGAHTRGFHTTSYAGIIGASVCAAKILNLNDDQIENALGLACSFASGLRQSFGTMANSFHVGMAASNGVRAAFLAGNGADSNVDFLSGGFCQSVDGDGKRMSEYVKNLGVVWAFNNPGIIIKDYPCCFSACQAVEAAIEIAESPGFDANDIQRITIRTSENHFMSLPSLWPDSLYGQRFCTPFCVASALKYGRLKQSDFHEDAHTEPMLMKLAECTDYGVDHAQLGVPGFGYSTVSVLMKNGMTITKTAYPGKKHRAEEHSEEALIKKFTDCCTASPQIEHPEKLYKKIMRVLFSDLDATIIMKEENNENN